MNIAIFEVTLGLEGAPRLDRGRATGAAGDAGGVLADPSLDTETVDREKVGKRLVILLPPLIEGVGGLAVGERRHGGATAGKLIRDISALRQLVQLGKNEAISDLQSSRIRKG